MIQPITTWHEFIASRDPALLDALLAEDVVFHSPVVHSPQQGKAITRMYLMAAVAVLGNDSFRYLREIVAERHAALEFSTVIDGVEINGVDLIEWNDAGLIIDFKVMVRPLKAINKLHALMAAMLERLAADGFGHQPPVAYRALKFLVENGFAHRVRSLGAYAACMHPGEAHAPVFLICRGCDAVAEAPAAPVRAGLDTAASAVGFAVERTNIEALGLCPACQDAAA